MFVGSGPDVPFLFEHQQTLYFKVGESALLRFIYKPWRTLNPRLYAEAMTSILHTQPKTHFCKSLLRRSNVKRRDTSHKHKQT